MRAAAMKECPSFPLMRQTNVQSILPYADAPLAIFRSPLHERSRGSTPVPDRRTGNTKGRISIGILSGKTSPQHWYTSWRNLAHFT